MKTKIYDKRDDFDFDIVNFPFLDGDVPHSASYGVYISQLIRFARVSSHVDDFNTRNKVLTAKLLRQGYRYHKLRKAFSKFYRRHFDIVSKYNVGLKTLLLQGLSEPEFYGDLVYKFRKIIGKNDFPYHFGGDRVVQRSWVNFQCRGVQLILIRVGQGPTALAVGAGGCCLDIFTVIYPFLSSFSLSLGDGPI